ncbi:MAG: hypothetical protein Q4F39_00045 [Bacteroidia bacterium]|nr:hypothetical protein [Bacteroidia bacterium]
MKKFSIILLAALLVVPSCKNQNKNTEGEQSQEPLTAEQILSEELKINAANLAESAKKMKRIPFAAKNADGTFALSEKEKMVKPDYLLDPAVANNLISFTQKYRVIAMLGADLMITNLYEMANTDYKNAINKLLVDLNDDALNQIASIDWSMENDYFQEDFDTFVDEEYAAGRQNFFWESAAAFMVEQVYILTRNIDKFMPMFTDETAADVTFNFVCVHEGIVQMIANYPEMSSLNEVLEPLYVINAITVDQLKEQLMSIKSDIEAARAFLLQ